MIGVGSVCLIENTFFVGVGRIEYQFLNSSIPDEMQFIQEQLNRQMATSLLEASEGRALTKTRLS